MTGNSSVTPCLELYIYATKLWFILHQQHPWISSSPVFTWLVMRNVVIYLKYVMCSVVPVIDPEQNVQELVYDLRSQCDAIRVTKTVRPYRVVICPVNENSAALVVSDGRVMLWELKAHASKSSSSLRYSSLNIKKWFIL